MSQVTAPNFLLLYFDYCLWSAFGSFWVPPHQRYTPPSRPADNSISPQLWTPKPA